MEVRRIIKFGNSSYAISLPKEWIKKNNLNKGDLIFLEKDSNGGLVIKLNNNKIKKPVKEVSIKSSSDLKTTEREIFSAYVQGADIFSIATKNMSRDNILEIEKMLKNLPGVEILEKKPEEIIAFSFLDIENIKINDVIRKMDNIVRSMFEELQSYAENKKNKTSVSEIYKADNEVNRFFFLLWRLTVLGLNDPSFLSNIGKNAGELMHMWWLGMNIEFIGDEIKRIAKGFSEINLKKTTYKKFLDLLTKIKNHYISALTAYYKKDKETAINIASKKTEILELCESFSSDPKVLKINEKLKSIQSSIHNITKCALDFV